MREVPVEKISEAVRDLAIRSNIELGEDVIAAFERALEQEESPTGKEILRRLIENAKIAREQRIPMCQDT
ncbi:MAG: fumarate hydratase, partial [Candidatus Methanomethylicaceae archaeon]